MKLKNPFRILRKPGKVYNPTIRPARRTPRPWYEKLKEAPMTTNPNWKKLKPSVEQ